MTTGADKVKLISKSREISNLECTYVYEACVIQCRVN